MELPIGQQQPCYLIFKKNNYFHATFCCLKSSDIISVITPESLISIIDGCINHNQKAQKRLYELYSKRMMAVCLRYCGDYDVALDLMHDGFITLFNKIGSFENRGHFEGWMRKVFVNISLEYLRKQDTLRFSVDIDEARTLEIGGESVLDKISAKEIYEHISRLPDGFRTVFNLYVIEGYTHAEIAEMLNINEASSRSQIGRAHV